jgi:hypothetical protein
MGIPLKTCLAGVGIIAGWLAGVWIYSRSLTPELCTPLKSVLAAAQGEVRREAARRPIRSMTSSSSRVPCSAYTPKYPIPAASAPYAMAADILRQECDERTGEYRENGAGKDRDPLQVPGNCASTRAWMTTSPNPSSETK